MSIPTYTFCTPALEPADYDWPLSAPLKLEIEIQSCYGESEITNIQAVSLSGQPLPSANELLWTHFETQLRKVAIDATATEHARLRQENEEAKADAALQQQHYHRAQSHSK